MGSERFSLEGRGGVPKDILVVWGEGVQVSQTVRLRKVHVDLSST